VRERASVRCLRASLDAALESSDLLALVGGVVQSDCLGYARLRLKMGSDPYDIQAGSAAYKSRSFGGF
jgi:hypothetical protein